MSEVRIIPLGGAGEIGKNCTVIEQGDDLVVIDCGLSFPNEEMPGVDVVLPDFTYILQNLHKVRGVFLTHAHEDHVGALPYLLRQASVPVYATEFTHALIRSKLEEMTPVGSLQLETFKPGDVIDAGSLSVEPIRVTHSIPESCSVAVRTQFGVVLMTSDFKFDFTPVDGKLANITRLGELAKEGVVVLLSDSTNIDRPGWSASEREVAAGLRAAFAEAPGRIILTTFASQIHRIQQFFEVSAEFGRKVVAVGRRMEQNIEVCARLGYVRIPKGTQIKLEDARYYPPEQLSVLMTGSQGEPMSALVQASKESYGRLRIQEGDTILYSARPIPGNEAAIWRTVNRLFRLGARVIYESPVPIHVSGHGHAEELKLMINLTRPFYLAPVHGEPRHTWQYREMARAMGYPEHRLFAMEDGVPLVITENEAHLGEPVPCGRILVDNGGNPGVTEDLLRDRSNLAQYGVVTVTLVVDPEAGDLVGEPILSHKGLHDPDGTVLQAASQALCLELKQFRKEDVMDPDTLRHAASDVVRRAIFRQGQIRPLVVTTVVEA
ncbi:MAG: ribonuclease J [Fimbriimonadales bacterium]|nr:ribonuclease J [Fimbriimonadales bacterium]